MKRYSIVFVIVGILTISSLAQAGGGVGTTTGDFLRMDQGARAVAAGGAFVACADDVYATYWNPAGLALLERKEFGVSYAVWFEDIKNAFLAYGHPIDPKRGMTIGSSLIWLDVDDIDEYDSAGRYKGKTGVNNYALSFAYAQRFAEMVSFGLNLKGISQDLAGLKGSGIAADLGLLARGKNLSFGLNLANIGPELSTDGKKNKLPFNIRTGGAIRSSWGGKNSFLAIGLDFPTDSDLILHGGGESWLTEQFALRLGYDSLQGPSAGFGFLAGGRDSMKNVVGQLDYAATFPPNTDLDPIHRLSLTFKF